jgi:hypothetical protein
MSGWDTMAAVNTTGLYEEMITHLKKNKRMLFADELAPPAICSVGALIANIRQKSEPFHFVSGDCEDLGLNLTYVAPSGLAKSHAMKQFIDKKYGLLPQNLIKSAFRGKITEAGYIGTIKEGNFFYGDASRFAEGILCFNEISNLFLAAQQEHSGELINQVMESLTERHVSKSLGGSEPLEYDTWVTIWGGVQPKRFDFSQGLARRFFFVARNWTFDDLKLLKDRRNNRGRDKQVDMNEIESIRRQLATAVKTFAANEVKWDEKIYKYLYEATESHLDMYLVEKILIGHEVIDQYENDVITIRDSKTNRFLIDMAVRMQQMVSEGSDVSLMINVLESRNGVPTTTSELWNDFRRFSYNIGTFYALLDTCKKMKVVKTEIKNGQQMIMLNKSRR